LAREDADERSAAEVMRLVSAIGHGRRATCRGHQPLKSILDARDANVARPRMGHRIIGYMPAAVRATSRAFSASKMDFNADGRDTRASFR